MNDQCVKKVGRFTKRSVNVEGMQSGNRERNERRSLERFTRPGPSPVQSRQKPRRRAKENECGKRRSEHHGGALRDSLAKGRENERNTSKDSEGETWAEDIHSIADSLALGGGGWPGTRAERRHAAKRSLYQARSPCCTHLDFCATHTGAREHLVSHSQQGKLVYTR